MNKKYSMVALLVGLVSALQANEKKEESVVKQSYALSAPAKAIVGIGSALALVGGLYYWQASDVKKEIEQDDSGDVTSFNENEQQEEVFSDDVDTEDNDDFYQEEGLNWNEAAQGSFEYFKNVASNICSKAHSASQQAEQRFNDLKGYLNCTEEYLTSDDFKESVAKSVENVSENVEAGIDSVKFALKKVSEKGTAVKKLLLTGGKNKKSKKISTEPYRAEGTKEFQKKIEVKKLELKMKEKEQSVVPEKKEEPAKEEEQKSNVNNNGTEDEDNDFSVDAEKLKEVEFLNETIEVKKDTTEEQKEVLQPQLDEYNDDVSPFNQQEKKSLLQESNLSFEKQSTNSVINNTKYAVGGVVVVLGLLFYAYNR